MSDGILNIKFSMYQILPKKTTQGGQMLIGILVSMAIFMILAHALFTLMTSSFELVSFNKARITARHLAQEKMELIRNMKYSDVATIGGVPNGTLIPQSETVSRNGLDFTINTEIIFIDDSFDGISPSDSDPEDYKRARVEVSWQGVGQSRKNPIVFISDISANATGTTDGGSLVVLVFNANGQAVPQAEVTIEAPSLDPPVNLTLSTNNLGKIVIPGAPPCVSCYRITATKAGYSTDRTYASSEVTNPVKPDTSVFANDVTQISFAIDQLGALNINSVNSRENSFSTLGNVPFRIHGNKIIGTNASSQLVYKFDTQTSTNSSGLKNFTNMEWDVYRVYMPTSTSYDISGTTPLLPLNLTPSGSLDFTFATSAHSVHNYLLTIKDPSQNLIASASATLTDGGSYNETKNTGSNANPDFGQILFSNLSEDTYNLTATASGFLDFVGNIDVSGTTVSEIVLTPQ